MHSVVLSFPGHFFQTHLTVRSLLRYYPEVDCITFVLDDVECSPWQCYHQDFNDSIGAECTVPWHTITVSSLGSIRPCVAGWWRQQLVKLTLDRILPGSEWFVVDGDVIFDRRCDIFGTVPVSFRGDPNSNWSIMAAAYVRDVLGVPKGYLEADDRRAVTSPIPFRQLSASLLQALRHHVETRFQRDFVLCHLDWFADQTIVANIEPPDRWVMTEWELIESFRRHIQGKQLPFLEVGSGYALDIDTTDKQLGQNLFRHGYQRDTEVGAEWFRQHGVNVPSSVWQTSECWYQQREARQRS